MILCPSTVQQPSTTPLEHQKPEYPDSQTLCPDKPLDDQHVVFDDRRPATGDDPGTSWSFVNDSLYTQ
jgi:hypothetical protein